MPWNRLKKRWRLISSRLLGKPWWCGWYYQPHLHGHNVLFACGKTASLNGYSTRNTQRGKRQDMPQGQGRMAHGPPNWTHKAKPPTRPVGFIEYARRLVHGWQRHTFPSCPVHCANNATRRSDAHFCYVMLIELTWVRQGSRVFTSIFPSLRACKVAPS